MLLSLCTIALNEESCMKEILQEFYQQDYPHEQTEIVLVDGGSTDHTKQIMLDFKQQYEQEYYKIQVLDNPKRILAAGWNVALSNFSGDVILKVDAHASIPKDFVRKNVAVLESGEAVSGGYRPNIIDEKTPWKETLLLAESSMFGSSIAPYRRDLERSYVKSMFHAAYRREVFEKIGGFNEYLGRTEDNEINYRIREAGFQLCFDPEIISYQHTRSTLKKMLKQKYGNGYWIGLTLGVCPGCLSLFHFVPFAFIMAIIFTTVLACFGITWPALCLWGAYILAALVMSVAAVVKEKKSIQQLALPFLFFLLHVNYGIGTLVGLIKMPFWSKDHKVCPAVQEVKDILQNRKNK